MRRLIVFVAAAWPPHVAAHRAVGTSCWWTLDPFVWVPMGVFAVLYLRGILILALRSKRVTPHVARPYAFTSFCIGMAATFFALIWPLDALGETSFAAHMAQHMVLIVVAAPLFALAQPAVPLLIALPAFLRQTVIRLGACFKTLRILARPKIAFAVHGALVWIWHAPLLFEWALRWRWVHVVEHLAFIGSAFLFWNALRQTGRAGGDGYGTAVLLTLATLMHTGLLGALIAFSPKLLYTFYSVSGNMTILPMEDQQLAGLLMWIPAGLCYLIIGLSYAAAWLRCAEHHDGIPEKVTMDKSGANNAAIDEINAGMGDTDAGSLGKIPQ